MTTTDAQSLLADLIAKAKANGADAADAVLINSAALSHAERFGKPEHLERSESRDVGLRVFFGGKQAIVSSNDWDPRTLDDLVDRAVAMAKVVPDDPYCGLADPDELFTGVAPELDTHDPVEPTADMLIERARVAEEAALAVDGVTNSEGSESSWSNSEVTLAASNGFNASYAISRHGVGVSVIAGEGTAMERDYEFSSTVFGEDLDDSAGVGRAAGERAVKRLNPRKVATVTAPVVFDPRVSHGLLGHFAGAINGASIARDTSFLKDSMNELVFASDITIVDDPHRRRGLRSKPFDAEGIANGRRNWVEKGVLTSWVLDLRSARQLGLKSTGNAARGVSSSPSPSTTNLYMEPGELSPEALIGEIENGFYVTELMGFGISGLTGDYSRGASGFWIENGEIAYPVSEMTIASNLKDMYLNLTAADDLRFRYGANAPTVRIASMTIAGA
ncbi:MAG: PmbA protein [Alphaproteobacteria bacterium]|jgi:PmbA protein